MLADATGAAHSRAAPVRCYLGRRCYSGSQNTAALRMASGAPSKSLGFQHTPLSACPAGSMLTQPAPFARQKYCCSVDGITVRAHSRSQKVLNSLSRASFWLGQAQAAPGSTGAGCSSTRAGGAAGAGAGSSSSLREAFCDAERVLVDVFVDVDDFDEELLELDDEELAVVVSDALVCVVVGVGAAVVLVYGKSSSGSASRTSSSLAQPASSAAAMTAALLAGTARLLLTARVSFRSAAGTLSKSPLG